MLEKRGGCVACMPRAATASSRLERQRQVLAGRAEVIPWDLGIDPDPEAAPGVISTRCGGLLLRFANSAAVFARHETAGSRRHQRASLGPSRCDFCGVRPQLAHGTSRSAASAVGRDFCRRPRKRTNRDPFRRMSSGTGREHVPRANASAMWLRMGRQSASGIRRVAVRLVAKRSCSLRYSPVARTRTKSLVSASGTW